MFIRLLLGLPFIYLLSGYPLARLFLPAKVAWQELIIASVSFSLLLTYPAGVLNVIREGQSGTAIFGPHLMGDIGILLVIFLLSLTFLKKKITLIKLDARVLLVFIPMLVSVFFNFYDLNRADLNGDEYDLGYQAYNLVDGIFAGRKAYTLSFSAHPPLTMSIQHFTMQVLEPRGLDLLSDWMFRMAPAILGVITVGITFFLGLQITGSPPVALLAALLLAVNNYHIFLSRIFQREMFLSFFLTAGFFWFVRYLKTKDNHFLILTSVSLGGAMLIKSTAIILLPVVTMFLVLVNKRDFLARVKLFLGVFLLMFSPVLLYNLGAYLKVGYTDIFFSRIFSTKTHPGASLPSTNILSNQNNLVSVLVDQYGVFLFLAFVGAIIILFIRKRSNTPIYFLLVTISAIIAFFLINGVRIYYLALLTPLLVITLATGLTMGRFNLFISGLIGTVLLIYSGIYSYRTFFGVAPRVIEGFTQAYPNPLDNLWQNYSLTTRGFLEERGWKTLQKELDKNYTQYSCLVLDLNSHPLQLRRYLNVGDKIKEFYLGSSYNPRYKLCSQWPALTDRWFVATTDREVIYEHSVDSLR